MKPKKCVLLVDDKDQSAVMDDIRYRMNSKFDVEFLFIRTSRADFKKDYAEEVDPIKVKLEIQKKIADKDVDIAVTDFDLNSEEINGFDVIEMTYSLRHSLKFLMYSGNWDKVIRCVIGKDYQNAEIDKIVDGVNKLIHRNIVNCIGREDYRDELMRYLSEEKHISMEHRLVKLLRSNKNLTFLSCYPEFTGKTFGEIADIIEKGSDSRSDEWIESILSQTIAYLISVNHE